MPTQYQEKGGYQDQGYIANSAHRASYAVTSSPTSDNLPLTRQIGLLLTQSTRLRTESPEHHPNAQLPWSILGAGRWSVLDAG